MRFIQKYSFMNFVVSSTYLSSQLKVLSGVVSNNNTLPILDNFLFELSNEKLKITASDTETILSATIEVTSSDVCAIAVPHKLLSDTVSKLEEQPLKFGIKENNQLELVASSGAVYRMPYYDGDEYPKANPAPLEHTFSLDSDLLLKGVGTTLFATTNDNLRPATSGVFFEFDSSEGLNLVSTDTNRMVRYQRGDISFAQNDSFIVPRKPLGLLGGFLGGETAPVAISYNKDNVCFVFQNIVMVCRLVDATYPPYRSIIPREQEADGTPINFNKMIVDKNALLSELRIASTYASATTHCVNMSMKGTELAVFASDADYSRDSTAPVPCNYQGEDMETAFNVKFLIEMLNNLPCGEFCLKMSSPKNPAVLTPVDGLVEHEDIMMLVMPAWSGND